MSLSKRLLFISLFLSTMQLGAMAPIEDTSPHQLNKQMKNFRHRVHIYFHCLRGKCTPEERMAAEKTILKDGAILFSALMVAGVGVFLGTKYGLPQWKDYSYTKALAAYKKTWNPVTGEIDNNYISAQNNLTEKRKNVSFHYFLTKVRRIADQDPQKLSESKKEQQNLAVNALKQYEEKHKIIEETLKTIKKNPELNMDLFPKTNEDYTRIYNMFVNIVEEY